MRLVITATTAGDEVSRQVVEERDVQNAVSNIAYQALGLYRDSHGQLDGPDTVTIVIAPHIRLSDFAPEPVPALPKD